MHPKRDIPVTKLKITRYQAHIIQSQTYSQGIGKYGVPLGPLAPSHLFSNLAFRAAMRECEGKSAKLRRRRRNAKMWKAKVRRTLWVSIMSKGIEFDFTGTVY